MRKTITACAGAALLAAGLAAGAGEAAGEKPPGKRLRLQFQETRERGDTAGSSRTSSLLLHADAGWARVFVGSELTITQNEKEATTTVFKDVGLSARVDVKTLPDGRYRLTVDYEDSQKRGLTVERAPSPVTAGNPVLQAVKTKSDLVLRDGESVSLASAIDPVTGELVHVEIALAAAPPPKAAATAAGSSRLRAQLVVTRRQGQTIRARRPYTVLQEVDEGEDDPVKGKSEVFSGSQLPVQTYNGNNRVIVALKDVGAGLQLGARRLADGRYRLNVRFSDGVLSLGDGAPELHVFQSESTLFVSEGETLTLASAVDPQTGEQVDAELTIGGLK
jgi:Bacterial type II and III secretion system protein